MSNLVAPLFHATRLTSFFHPPVPSDRTPICFSILKVISVFPRSLKVKELIYINIFKLLSAIIVQIKNKGLVAPILINTI
nr:MAG TPA: hypothetical protein [Caudoviricetes sp.]